MDTIYELEKGVKDEINERLANDFDGKSDLDAIEAIEFIIDEWIPIYNSDLLKIAQSNLRLAVTEPDFLPCKGECHPCKLIAINIYEYLHEIIFERYEESKN